MSVNEPISQNSILSYVLYRSFVQNLKKIHQKIQLLLLRLRHMEGFSTFGLLLHKQKRLKLRDLNVLNSTPTGHNS